MGFAELRVRFCPFGHFWPAYRRRLGKGRGELPVSEGYSAGQNQENLKKLKKNSK